MAGDLGDAHATPERVDHDLGLDLEAVGGELHRRHRGAPQGHEAVAQLGEVRRVEQVDQAAQAEVAEQPSRRQVGRAAGRPGALHEVVALVDGPHVALDLGRIHAAVGVDHDDDLAGGPGEPGPQCHALALAEFRDDHDVRAECPGHLDGAVLGPAVDHDDLLDPGRHPLQHPADVGFLVQRGDHQADRRGPEEVRRVGELRDLGFERQVAPQGSGTVLEGDDLVDVLDECAGSRGKPPGRCGWVVEREIQDHGLDVLVTAAARGEKQKAVRRDQWHGNGPPPGSFGLRALGGLAANKLTFISRSIQVSVLLFSGCECSQDSGIGRH